MLVLIEFRNADTNGETSVHPPPPLVRRAESMTNKEKHATQALDWINGAQRSKPSWGQKVVIRTRNDITCNLFVQRIQGHLSPVVLNKKNYIYMYCTVKPAGWRWSKLSVPVRALEVGALVKFSRWRRTWHVGTLESNGVSRNKI